MVHLPLFHGGNTGSNPVGDARLINMIQEKGGDGCPGQARTASRWSGSARNHLARAAVRIERGPGSIQAKQQGEGVGYPPNAAATVQHSRALT